MLPFLINQFYTFVFKKLNPFIFGFRIGDNYINVFNITIAEDNSLAGVGACNRLLGQVVVGEKQAISFGQVGTTMMLCPENGQLESRFTQMLGGVTHYDIDGDKLLLLENGAIKAIFQALPVADK